MFKTYKDKNNIESLGKNPQNHENVRNETDVYEQKPIKIDDFNEAEEKEVKECVEKWKIERKELAEKNKLFFKKKSKRKTKKLKKNYGQSQVFWTKSSKTLRNIKKAKKILT